MAEDKFQPLINSINEGKVANVALEFMDKELSRLHDAVDSSIFAKMNAGTKVSYEELTMAFAEKHAYKSLMKAMRQASRKGESAGGSYKKLTQEKEDGRDPGRIVPRYRVI